MKDLVIDYILKKSTVVSPNDETLAQSTTRTTIDAIKELIFNVVFALQCMSLRLTQEMLIEIERDVNSVNRTLGLDSVIEPINQENPLYSLKRTLKKLNEPSVSGVEHKSHPEKTLMIDDYDSSNPKGKMLHINHLEFGTGKIYAISGKNGIGKTCLLSDILECLGSGITTKGTITLPEHDNQVVPKIYCGNAPFAPPGTSLLDKLTYRLPKDYRDSHKEELANDALALFKRFEQPIFKEPDKLNTKKSIENMGLSGGQKQLLAAINILLYKAHTQKPVLLILDESFSNVDHHTTKIIWNFIKEKFADSIVLSVDHHIIPECYDQEVNLGQYYVGFNQVELSGN